MGGWITAPVRLTPHDEKLEGGFTVEESEHGRWGEGGGGSGQIRLSLLHPTLHVVKEGGWVRGLGFFGCAWWWSSSGKPMSGWGGV